MRSLLVLLTGSKQSWQAAYTGYDLAAQKGQDLVGAVVTGRKGRQKEQQLKHEFETGARAAGTTFSSINVKFEAGHLSGNLPNNLQGMLVGQQDLHSSAELAALLRNLSCALWVIALRRELSRALAFNAAGEPARFMRHALSMAQDWGWSFESLDVSVPAADAPGAPALEHSLMVDRRQFIERLTSQPPDLTLVPMQTPAEASWDLLSRSDRAMIFIPSA